MRKIILLFLLVSGFSFSQILEPVKWVTSVEKISNLEYTIVLTANIDTSWHLYSQQVPENGPLPTIFIFTSSSNYTLVGDTTEEKGHVVYEKVFDMKIKYFDTKAIFKQRIKKRNNSPLKIIGEIEYMSCNSEKCVPGYDDFEIAL
ncbi:protein-disulfide reductase DsbD domain-containing protein [Mariniflexile sp. AS56]|uniref:protein-disulfide reductase DsbD domain-containing protein n=1 Tax=Mariniflexile sp. AS56 TaxID=3063957 RepID=UPI0026F14036|nr:protein-disulfide reductase DsbD domain-containing protein [Mariniflexile sp. AS56]MDO7174129.1 protein-disulfide reductase DsbD family protein [Mariniflexile sp. AS56]